MGSTYRVKTGARSRRAGTTLAAACLWPAAGLLTGHPLPAAAQQVSGIEEIVVTAQRRDQSLRDVPIALSAFTADSIEKNMFRDVSDYMQRTPNASFISNGARSRRQISIRGVTNFLGFVGSSTTGFYVDDFSVAGSTVNPPIMDIERIEILRGPQATYFGRNALGGGISITTRKPDNEFGGSVMVDYSRFNTIDTEGVLNVPLIDDRLAMRINAKYFESDGNIKNIHPIGGGNDSEYQYIRPSLRFTPTDNLTIDATWQYVGEDVGMREGVPSGVFSTFAGEVLYPGLLPDRTGDGRSDPFIDEVGFFPQNRNRTNFNNPQRVGTNFRNGVLRIDYEPGDLLLTSITGYINSKFYLAGDIDGGSRDFFNEFRNIKRDSISQEVRLQNTDDARLQWSVGGIVAEDEGSTWNRTLVGAEQIFGIPEGTVISSTDSEFKSESWALFGQVDYALTDTVIVSVGGRYSEEKIRTNVIGQTGVQETVVSAQDTFTDFSPRFALNWTVSDEVSVYGTVSKGFKSGGVQIAPSPERESYDPETLWNYEIGVKTELLDRRLLLNLAVFYMDWEDLQVAFQENLIDADGNFVLFGGTDNAESATSKGVELELTALLTDNLLVNAGAGYLNAKFDRFVAFIDSENVVLDGRTIPNAPKWTFSADAEYSFALTPSIDAWVRTEWTYRDSIRATTSAMVREGFPWEVPSYNYFNLRAGMEFERWRLVAYVENVFDRNFYTNAYEKAFTGGLHIEPSFRTFGLRATYRFGAM